MPVRASRLLLDTQGEQLYKADDSWSGAPFPVAGVGEQPCAIFKMK